MSEEEIILQVRKLEDDTASPIKLSHNTEQLLISEREHSGLNGVSHNTEIINGAGKNEDEDKENVEVVVQSAVVVNSEEMERAETIEDASISVTEEPIISVNYEQVSSEADERVTASYGVTVTDSEEPIVTINYDEAVINAKEPVIVNYEETIVEPEKPTIVMNDPIVVGSVAVDIPMFELLDGNKIPAIGLGTWFAEDSDVEGIVGAAIDMGYRHFDCAQVYQNEASVGNAIARKIEQGVVTRADLFVTSKLWASSHKRESVEKACRQSLEHLGLDYLDLYLMHTPFGFKDGAKLLPKIAGVVQYSHSDYLETWFAMEDLVKKGLVKSIGVANFNSEQISKVWGKAKIKPVVNQVECHPYLNQKKISEICKAKGIIVCAYGVMGSARKPNAKQDLDTKLSEDGKILRIADKYQRSAAQILQRYQMEKEHVFIQRTTNLEHLRENLEVFNFALEEIDMRGLESMKKAKRYIDFHGTRRFGDEQRTDSSSVYPRQRRLQRHRNVGSYKFHANGRHT